MTEKGIFQTFYETIMVRYLQKNLVGKGGFKIKIQNSRFKIQNLKLKFK